MKQDGILLELYEVGRRVQPAIYGSPDVSLPTQTRFEKALDAAQDKLFPESKHKIQLKHEGRTFFLMGERLAEIGIDKKPWRWIMRRDLVDIKLGTSKHVPLYEGQGSSWPVEVIRGHNEIDIGCIGFNQEAVKQIDKWLKEKLKNGRPKRKTRRT